MGQVECRQSLLQRLSAGGLQLAHVAVRLPVASAHVLAESTPTEALGQPLARRVFALQRVAARQVVLSAARLSLRLGAHQAAVAAIRHVAAGAAGARTGTHIAPCRTLVFGLCEGGLLKVQEHSCVQEDVHL